VQESDFMKRTILITSAGRRSQLLECFRDDSKQLGIDLRVVAADSRPELSAACCLADAAYEVPRCLEEDYIPALQHIVAKENVDLLVPTIDTELLVLSENRMVFAELGARVVVSAAKVVRLATDKQRTAEVLRSADINTPQTLSLQSYLKDPQQIKGPLIVKPNSGSASIGIIRPQGLAELQALVPEKYIVQELLQGKEYTVNMFFDQKGELRCAIPHLRIEVRSGEVSKGRTEHVSLLTDAATRLSSVLSGAEGPLCFQAIVDPQTGRYGVFEINARFGGGFPLAHAAGAKFSRWLLEESLGMVPTCTDSWIENVTMLRYDAAVFLGRNNQ
jgi:carbamoyl-phosphate synthase large subunit